MAACTGTWCNMDVAVKIMLFQNSNPTMVASSSKGTDRGSGYCPSNTEDPPARRLVLREAAVCCSVSHPNVVATYYYEVLQASAFHHTPSGLEITDHSGVEAFKLYLIQVCGQGVHE